MLQLNAKAGLATSIAQELFTVSSAKSTLILPIHTIAQRIKNMPSLYKAYSSVIQECEAYLAFIKTNSKEFTSDTSQGAVDEYMKKVIEGVRGIRLSEFGFDWEGFFGGVGGSHF